MASALTESLINILMPFTEKTLPNGSQTIEYTLIPPQIAKISSLFTYHKPEPNMLPRFEEIREAAKNLAFIIAKSCPPGTFQDQALINLQTVVMQANASIATENLE